MQVKQCRSCGKLFQSLGSPLCMECNEQLDERFRLVRDYLYSHPSASVIQLSKATGVSERDILTFLKEDRLALNQESELMRCEKCGKAIASGRLCEHCKEELSRVLSSKAKETAPGSAPGPVPGMEERKSVSYGRLGKMHLDYKE